MTIAMETVERFIREELDGLDTLRAPDALFFYYDPERDTPHDRRQPFTTILTRDDYPPTRLDRPGVYRLNVGVTRETYRAMFGPEPAWNPDGPVATGHEFSALDTFLPHPVYAPLAWICISSPSERSWPRVQALIREAHAHAAKQHARRAATRGGA